MMPQFPRRGINDVAAPLAMFHAERIDLKSPNLRSDGRSAGSNGVCLPRCPTLEESVDGKANQNAEEEWGSPAQGFHAVFL
jgi:hypothetical protein